MLSVYHFVACDSSVFATTALKSAVCMKNACPFCEKAQKTRLAASGQPQGPHLCGFYGRFIRKSERVSN